MKTAVADKPTPGVGTKKPHGSALTVFTTALALVLAMPGTLPAAETATVTLVGGTKITATILRENEEGIVLDLGYDIIHVPSRRVLNVEKSGGAKSPAVTDAGTPKLAEVKPAETSKKPPVVAPTETANGNGGGNPSVGKTTAPVVTTVVTEVAEGRRRPALLDRPVGSGRRSRAGPPPRRRGDDD
ncbi:MAG: hypothetical protein QM775_04925 [Pirellulales bacterium]